jgi:hypothetical protein
VDKWLWFVEAHQQDRPVSSGTARAARGRRDKEQGSR